MKKPFLLLLLITVTAIATYSQDDGGEKKGFKKENLFTGGSITASFYTGGTVLGANPVFGYKLTDWADAGIAVNYTYAGQRDRQFLNDKVRQHVYGGGMFARLYPIRFIFLQGQFEHNFTNFKYISPGGNVQRFNTEANSFLVGAGLAQGRERGATSFFYISLLVDVIGDINSPYVNPVYDINTGQLLRIDKVPIIRAGVNIGLFQGRGSRE